jgi:hypothetical protein
MHFYLIHGSHLQNDYYQIFIWRPTKKKKTQKFFFLPFNANYLETLYHVNKNENKFEHYDT